MNQMLNHYDFKYENGANSCEFHIKSEEINCLHSEYAIKVENISYSEDESENENLQESDSFLREIKQEIIAENISFSEAESENLEESDSWLREIEPETIPENISNAEAQSENENLENSDSSLGEIKQERRDFKPKKYVCYVCKQHYIDKELLESHIQVHLKNGAPYKCKKCNKNINHISNFKRHIRVHTGEKLHECGICMLSFNTSWQLKIHQERAHQNINRYSLKRKKFVCDKCEKSFYDNGHLHEHLKFHGVREFDCQDCGKSYFTKSGLNRHVSAIHKLEKKHKCDLCDKRFGRNWDLKVHMIQHGRNHNVKAHVVCDICNKIFSCQSKFKQHLKVHIQIE